MVSKAYRGEIAAKIKAAKFKKITVNTKARDGQTPVVLTGTAHAGLIVHRDSGNRALPGYLISHIASGKSLGHIGFKTQLEAKAAVVRLADLGDWHSNTDEFIAAVAPSAVALLIHCHSNGAFTP